jgi:hypothetical protein
MVVGNPPSRILCLPQRLAREDVYSAQQTIPFDIFLCRGGRPYLLTPKIGNYDTDAYARRRLKYPVFHEVMV